MPNASRYLTSLDETPLFSEGVLTWRLDVSTWRSLRAALADVEWITPAQAIQDGDIEKGDDGEDSGDATLHEPGVGRIGNGIARDIRDAVRTLLADPVLLPGLTRLYSLEPGIPEVFNATYDTNWHHDGLSGKRGHAGEFFFIAWFGEPDWDPSWGGAFEYGTRSLKGSNWVHDIGEPREVRRILPSERTCLLGWNQDPRLIHRAAPLLVQKDRITVITPLRALPAKPRPHGRSPGPLAGS